ncbi:hypothetical protein F6X91_02760 [Enterococcus durans]|uniref:hypothetical protein n=2 Tax=Enterococcus durans TaxID=53345 RepID=UPI001248366E|nr:hypothetical protein [Enterococcus durans]KAA9187391.1 hypothetical protein F6X85_04205 [Enterococcus durans]KAA9200487.1 hypothetical protein F6X91_02760 [Enterococcus durans]
MKTKKLRIIVPILMLFQNFTFPSAILAEKMEQRLSEESPVNLSESSPPEKASSEQFSEKLPSLEESTSESTSESSVENITNTQELIEIPKEITVQASENMKSRLITEQLRQILYSDGEQSYIVKTLQPSISQRITLGNTVGSTQKFTVIAPAASTSNGNGNDWISLIASDTEEHDSRYRWMQYGDFRGEPHKYALTNVWIDSMPEGIELMEVTTPSVNNQMVSFTVTIKRTIDTGDTSGSFSLTGDIRLGTTATTGSPDGEPIKNIEDVKYLNATLGRITVDAEDNRKITAEASASTVVLGTNIKEIAYEDFVKNVKLGDEVLTKDKYTVELIGEYATDYLGEKTAKVRVTLKATPTNTTEVDVPVQILWGNSIAYGGLGYVGGDRTTAVFSLHQGSKPKITISQGQSNDNYEIHSYFPGEKYYSFDWFNLKSATDIHMTSDKKGDQSIEAEGQEKKQDALKKWQTQEVSHGDVVRSWVTEHKNHLYVNENREFNGNEAYYEITKNGYQLLNFNKLKITKQSVIHQATKEEMDKAVQSYINTSGHQNIKVVKFMKYPDTSSLKDTEGIIRIAETLASGKTVTYDYTVPFSVVKDNSWIKVKVATKILFAQISKESGILSPEYEIVNLSERGIKVSINSVIRGTSSELIPELNLHSTNLTNGHKITLVTPNDSNNFPQELGVMTKKMIA